MSEAGERGSVVVTGAGTGIGRVTALHLARHGFHVFAGIFPDEYEPSDGRDLVAEAAGRITLVPLDVTDAESVRKAAEQVTAAAGDAGLAGLVNNAGISVAGPLEFLPLDRLRMQLEVNVVGMVAVTQAFLPLIRAGHGRIVNLGSVQGRLTLPLAGAYCASKSTVEALTRSLRMELAPWGIEVCLIEPGYVATRMANKASAAWDALESQLPQRALDLYRPVIDRARALVESVGDMGSEPQVVADGIFEALTARHPKARMLVARGSRAQAIVAAGVPERARDRLIDSGFNWLARARRRGG